MSPEAQQVVAGSFLPLAALHHLAVAVVAVLFWIKRRSMERTVGIYLALAFATTAVALASQAAERTVAVLPAVSSALAAAVLAALWVAEAARPRNVLSFRRAPRVRVGLMVAVALFAMLYPRYSHGLPAFVFSPLGVTLPPTLLLALAVMNSAAPRTNHPLHWSLAVAGLVVGAKGLLIEGWIHVPLVGASFYAVPLLLGRAVLMEDPGEADATSVRAVHDRMHKRRVLMSRPRRASVRKLDIRKRKQ